MKRFFFSLALLALFFSCTPQNIDNNGEEQNESSTCPSGAVDLGIIITRQDGTSYKLYWAECNLGASSPGAYGDLYAWGETNTKSEYSMYTYKFFSNISYNSLTLSKYNKQGTYGKVDNKTVLDLEDDVAHVKLGAKWRMPTIEEWDALRKNCTWKWTKEYNVNGYKVTGNNGNSIFLPAGGYILDKTVIEEGESGYYQSSSLDTQDSTCSQALCFNSQGKGKNELGRFFGQSVRAVSE